MSRKPPHTPVRRPPLPFELDGSEVHGYAFVSGDRWMAIATDEMTHAIAVELRRLPAPVRDPIPAIIGRAMVAWLN